MTQNEKKQIIVVINNLKVECNTLEELYLSSRHINYRWVKQAIEKEIENLKKLL